MPDNPIPPWLTQPILADEIGGAGGPLAQIVKLGVGGNGVANEVPGDVANGIDVDVTRIQAPVFTDPVVVAATAVSRVPASAASVTLAAANGNRRGLIVYNDSASDMLIKYGVGTTAASFTVRVLSKWSWEMPQPIFTGLISCLWEAVAPAGGAQVTEI